MSRRCIVEGLLAVGTLLWSLQVSAAVVVDPTRGTWTTTLQARYLDGDATPDAWYDTVLGITWLANANAGAGTEYDNGTLPTDGRMTWANANGWATQGLVYSGTWGTAEHWRLPSMIDTGVLGCEAHAYSGTDCGFNVQTYDAGPPPVHYSELAHMFYTTLGNLAWRDTSGSGPQAGWDQLNSGPFSGLDRDYYWSGAEIYSDNAWYLYFNNGLQANHSESYQSYAWAVHPGDVGSKVNPVPLPAAVWLLGSGLIGLLSLARPREVT